MKVQFMFRRAKYFAKDEQQAREFLNYWKYNHGNIYPMKTNWNIEHVERGPGWSPYQIDFSNIEFSKP